MLSTQYQNALPQLRQPSCRRVDTRSAEAPGRRMLTTSASTSENRQPECEPMASQTQCMGTLMLYRSSCHWLGVECWWTPACLLTTVAESGKPTFAKQPPTTRREST